MVLPIAWHAYCDLNADLDFVDANEDLTGDLIELSYGRGRASVTQDFGAGVATLKLLNTSGKYSPFNTGSAIYGTFIPGREVKIEAVHNAITYACFRGYIDEITESVTPDGAPYVTVTCRDLFDKLSRGSLRISLVQAVTVTNALVAVRQATNLNAALASFGGGLVSLPFGPPILASYWEHQSSPTDAFKRAARQDPGSQLFVDGSGIITYKNRYDRSAQPVYATLTGPRAISLAVRQSDFVDSVEITRAGLTEGTSNEVLFYLFPTGRALLPGSTDSRNTIAGDFLTGGKSVVTPVATTDYTANTASDGTGTDVTAFVTVSAFTSYGGAFSVTFLNSYPSTVYLTLLSVRGIAIRQSDEDRRIRASNASPLVYDQAQKETFEFLDDETLLQGYATIRLYQLSVLQPRLTILPPGRTDAELAVILGAELGKRVTVTNTTGAYPSKIDADFIIEGMRVKSIPGQYVEAEWDVFHEDIAGGNFFRISGASGAGADYSTCGGSDRIAI